MMAVRLWTLRFLEFLKLGRLLFLAGGVVLFGLGVAIARFSGATINWKLVIWGQITVTATQLMVHYSNDYYDFEADQHNLTPTAWSGGSRVLQAGILPRRTALIAAIGLALIAVIGVLLLALTEHPGALTVPMVLIAVALSWEYSSPPLKLHAHGIGEVCGVFVVSGLTPVLAFYLQTRQITLLPLLAVLPICCLQFNMLLSVDIPDADGDAATNKRTLVVRLGRPASLRLYLVVLASAYVLLLPAIWLGFPPWVGLCFSLTLPLALWIAWHGLQGHWLVPANWGQFAFFSIALVMSAALLELMAFVLLSVR